MVELAVPPQLTDWSSRPPSKIPPEPVDCHRKTLHRAERVAEPEVLLCSSDPRNRSTSELARTDNSAVPDWSRDPEESEPELVEPLVEEFPAPVEEFVVGLFPRLPWQRLLWAALVLPAFFWADEAPVVSAEVLLEVPPFLAESGVALVADHKLDAASWIVADSTLAAAVVEEEEEEEAGKWASSEAEVGDEEVYLSD